MNPPVREARHQEALREALADGTIACIGSDHAPHTRGGEGAARTRRARPGSPGCRPSSRCSSPRSGTGGSRLDGRAAGHRGGAGPGVRDRGQGPDRAGRTTATWCSWTPRSGNPSRRSGSARGRATARTWGCSSPGGRSRRSSGDGSSTGTTRRWAAPPAACSPAERDPEGRHPSRAVYTTPLAAGAGPTRPGRPRAPPPPPKTGGSLLDEHDRPEGARVERPRLRQGPGEDPVQRGLRRQVARPLLVPPGLHLRLPDGDQGLPAAPGDFKDDGVEVLGVSTDSFFSHNAWFADRKTFPRRSRTRSSPTRTTRVAGPSAS